MVRSRLASTAVLTMCLLASALAYAPTAPSGADTPSDSFAPCHPTWLRASVAATQTSPRGSALTLAETNVGTDYSRNYCTLLSPLSVQLLGRNGQKVVPAVTTPSFAPGVRLLTTYQGTFSVSIHSVMPCRRPAMVAAIRVTSGAATSVVHLGLPLSLCASRPQPLTVSPVSFPHPAPCRNGALKTLVGWPNGAAGTIFYGIRYQNVGTTACTVHGIPTVLPIAADGVPVAPPAQPVHNNVRATPVVLGVHDGVTAWSLFGVVETANFPPTACAPTSADAIRVTLPGYAPADLPLAFSVCTRLHSTNVDGVAPDWFSR